MSFHGVIKPEEARQVRRISEEKDGIVYYLQTNSVKGVPILSVKGLVS